MPQQQRPRDRIAQMQQMSGSSEFQPQAGPGDQPKQMGGGSKDSPRDDGQDGRELRRARRERRSHSRG